MSSNIKVDNLQYFDRSKDVEYIISVGHTAPTSNSINVTQNNYTIVNNNIDAVSGNYSSAVILTEYNTVPSSSISSNNLSTLRFEYGGLALYPYHNFYEIHYPAEMKPINNQIVLFSNIVDYKNPTEVVEYSINGFSGDIYGFDVSDMSNPKQLSNIANTGGFFIFKAAEDSAIANTKKYFIAGTNNVPIIENISMINLRDVNSSLYSNSDMIVITADEFINSANRFAEYRSKQSNIKVSVVPLSKIYAEFSYSRVDLVAVRNYIQYAYEY